ncbi:putative peroxygenase 4 [Silene latifolia]|uniref:putative peroxygenase 4 n=1 Tax=Silene latifolia TaxID=37657 RepID=UPI003D76D9FB
MMVAFFPRKFMKLTTTNKAGLHAIGCSKLVSIVAGIGFHLAFSITTRQGKFPNPSFMIEIQNIPKAKNGSNSGVYDSEGRFVVEKFDEILSKHIHLNKNGLNLPGAATVCDVK